MVTIETERLRIRNFSPEDAQALHEMIVQYQASPYAIYDHQWPTSPEEVRGVAEWFAGGDSFLAVCLKSTERFIGFVSLNGEEQEGRKQFDLGYVFNSDHHGRGYATEACRALLDRAFGELQADAVTCGTAAANEPSCRLLGRLGLRKVGEGTGSFRKRDDGTPIEFTGYAFAVSREEWEAGKPSD